MNRAERIEESLRKAIEKDGKTRSQRDLATAAGISHPSIFLFLARKRTLKWNIVARLLAVLDLEIAPAREKAEAVQG